MLLLIMLLLFKGPQGASTLHITVVQLVIVFSFSLLLKFQFSFNGIHTILLLIVLLIFPLLYLFYLCPIKF